MKRMTFRFGHGNVRNIFLSNDQSLKPQLAENVVLSGFPKEKTEKWNSDFVLASDLNNVSSELELSTRAR